MFFAVLLTHTLTTQSQSARSRRRFKQFLLFFRVPTVRFKCKSAARRFVFFFFFFVELCVFKIYLGILRYFSLFYWLFKEKFNIFVTIKSDKVIFWASTEKAKFVVWIQICIFIPDGCRDTVFGAYTVLFLTSKDSVFKTQLSFAITRPTAKCFTSKFAASQFFTRSSGVPSFISLLTSPIEILSFKSKSQFQGIACGWFIGSACPDPISLPPAAFFV